MILFQIYFTGGEIETLAILKRGQKIQIRKFGKKSNGISSDSSLGDSLSNFLNWMLEKAGLNLTTNTLAALCTFNS